MNNPEKLFCNDHPTGFVGTDQFGHYYPTCVQGHREGKEKCDLRNAETGEKYGEVKKDENK